MKFKWLAGLALSTLMLGTAAAETWQPSGPIKFMIAFRAGGGADTQARLLAEEVEAKYGWKLIPENVAGKGGALMARALKKEPADGLSIGITVSSALSYDVLASRDPGYSKDDFTLLSTTTGTQMAIFAKASRGWKTIEDVFAEIKQGKKITIGTLTPNLADANYVIAKNNDVELTTVMVKGGKGALNGVLADDLDLGWGAGPQNKSVATGDLINLVAAESQPLKVSPDAPLMKDINVPYTFGSKFLIVAPKGLPEETRTALTKVITSVVGDPESKTNQFVTKAFSGAEIISGADLDKFITDLNAADQKLLDVASQ